MDIVPVDKGGTGAKNKADACANLKAMSVDTAIISNADLPTIPSRIFQADISTTVSNGRPYNYWLGLNIADGALNYAQIAFPLIEEKVPKIRYRINTPSPRFTEFREFLVKGVNTTVDGNGFIKNASPVVRLVSDPGRMPTGFLENFTLNGFLAFNDEAQGTAAEKVATGIYRVYGALGLHDDGWTIEVPQDVNGNRLCFVETLTDDDGTITVSVFRRKFDIDTAMIVAGEPMDIPDGRWIDLRLKMPIHSSLNKNIREQ